MKRFAIVAISLLGCQGPPTAEVESVSSALTSLRPLGMMCGMSYYNGSPWVSGVCDGARTIANPPELAPSFQFVSVGDSGLPAGNGFSHQGWAGDSARLSDSNQLALPKGTACGMKAGCFNHNPTCMGKDPSFECPLGWEMKNAADYRSPNGCVFVWCEYQDPGNLCPDGNCAMPRGLTCGIADNDAGFNPSRVGRCLGKRTWNDGCPAGFTRHGFFDDGRSGGHGIGWCEKN